MLRARPDRIQIRQNFRRKVQRSGFQILAKVMDRRRARNQQNIGGTLEEPGERDLHRRPAQRRCRGFQSRGLQRGESAEWKKRRKRDPFGREDIDHGVVIALREVVPVLNADDLRDGLSFHELPRRNVAEPDMADKPLSLEIVA